MNNSPVRTTSSPFDSTRQVENGREFWSARQLQKLLGYTEWRKFEDAIERAMIACKNSGQAPLDHFVRAANMINTGKGAKREISDYHLSRYASYLIAMNSDPRKEEVSQAQTYFAVKTRQAELQQPAPALPLLNSLWEKRLDYFHKHTKLPSGYWSIFGMVAAYCRSDEFRNVHLAESALPDGSVGKRWCQYLREQGYDMNRIRKYKHTYPDKRGAQDANIYPTEWLGAFWDWFHGTYIVEHYPGYLKGRIVQPLQIEQPVSKTS